MAANVIPILPSVTVTTTSTYPTSTIGVPDNVCSRYGAYLVDISAFGSGSGWTINLNYLTPAGNTIPIGTVQSASTLASSAIATPNALFANATGVGAHPPVNQIVFKPVTAGTTTSLTAAIWAINAV